NYPPAGGFLLYPVRRYLSRNQWPAFGRPAAKDSHRTGGASNSWLQKRPRRAGGLAVPGEGHGSHDESLFGSSGRSNSQAGERTLIETTAAPMPPQAARPLKRPPHPSLRRADAA